MEEKPERLYHYTNLQSLALILNNQTLRLMPLTGLDDPQENQTADIQNLGRFFFASCWTDDQEESIPMWNMYASLDSGVRISLPTSPFMRYKANVTEFAEATGIPKENIQIEGDQYTFLPISDLASGIISPQALSGDNILQRIIYTDDRNLLRPTILSSDYSSLDFKYFGKVKNKKWEFQHEWRYIIQILPINVFDSSKTVNKRLANVLARIIGNGQLPVPPFYDLHIDPAILTEIEIVPSPKTSPGNRVLLDALLEKCGLTARIMESELVGLL